MNAAEQGAPSGSCHLVTTQFSERRRPLFDLVGAHSPTLPYQPEGEHRFELCVGAEGVTITALSDDSKPAWTIARHEGGGASWWDHQRRECMTWTANEVVCAPESDEEATDIELRIDEEGRTASVFLNDPGVGDVELRFDCVPSELAEALITRLLDALYGTGCGNGAFPSRAISKLGLPSRIQLFASGEPEAIVTTQVAEGHAVEVTARTLRPPESFTPVDTGSKGPAPQPPAPEDASRWDQMAKAAPRIGTSQQALEVEDFLTPGCLARTRLSPLVGVVHQDLLDNVRAAVNLVTPHLGTVALSGGTLTIPWLATLEAADVLSGGTGPGSGLFTVLRENRQLVPQLTGGRGILDRLAWKLISTPDPSTGRTMLQEQAATGSLPATLSRWNVGANIEGVLLSNGGDMNDTRLTDADRSVLVEAFETFDIGTVTVSGMPATVGPLLWPAPAPGGPNLSLVSLTIGGIAGSMTFAPVGGPAVLSTFAIGSSGTIDVTLTLPATTLAATVARSTTALGTTTLIGAALTCFFFPLACATVTPLALLLLAILNDLSRITAVIPTTTLAYRIEFGYDRMTRHVEPTVALASAAGTATVTTTSSQPASIAAAFNSVLATLGNALNAWPLVLGASLAAGLQGFLRQQGVRFPLGSTRGLTAIDGTALSTPNDLLTLVAEIEPFPSTTAQPWITQVPPPERVRNRLELTHVTARRELNPAVPTGTMPATLNVGVYGGLALTQNVINSYVYARWRDGAFNVVVDQAPLVTRLVDALPPKIFGLTPPRRISVWPATPPRLEVAPEGLHAGEALTRTSDPVSQANLRPFSTGARPLVAYFDDVRVCFDATAAGGSDGPLQSGQWEFSFNFRTTATLDLRWPFSLELRTDAGPAAVMLSEMRTMEFADGALLSLPFEPAHQNWIRFATEIANLVAQRQSAATTPGSWAAPVWGRPSPYTVQQSGGDMLSLELLAARKTLTLLPMVRSPLLELVDGSGAPVLSSVLGINAPLPIGTLTRAQGSTLRNRLGPLLDRSGLAAFPGP